MFLAAIAALYPAMSVGPSVNNEFQDVYIAFKVQRKIMFKYILCSIMHV